MVDLLKARREGMRWTLLTALEKARPIGAHDELLLLLLVLAAIYTAVTPHELHCELEYLEQRELVEIDRKPDGHWHAKLTSAGIDVVEYTVDCDAGIARPAKYWG